MKSLFVRALEWYCEIASLVYSHEAGVKNDSKNRLRELALLRISLKEERNNRLFK